MEWIKGGSGTNPTALLSLHYDYDSGGNITEIEDYKMGINAQTPQEQDFSYDNLNRLLSASASNGTAGNYSESYTYNATTGNLASKGGVTYTYTDTLHAHAVTGFGSNYRYEYDFNGNRIERDLRGWA